MMKMMILSSFLFFSSSYIVFMRSEKVESIVGGQKKEHVKGRSEPPRKEEFVTRKGCVKRRTKIKIRFCGECRPGSYSLRTGSASARSPSAGL